MKMLNQIGLSRWLAKRLPLAIIVSALAACGGGTSDPTPTPTPAPTYTVSGTVSGLTGSGLVLQDNAADDTAVAAAGSFTFAGQLASGAAYAVSVKTQPSNPAQTCTVASGSGTVGVVSIGGVAVTCVAADADTRPLSLALAPPANAAMGTAVPYTVTERQGIVLTGTTWYFDGAVGGHALTGLTNGKLQVWNTPGVHTLRVVATASNGRSAEATASISAVGQPLAAGTSHSCALTVGSTVKCWGNGNSGALGDGSTSVASPPVSVTGGVLGVLALASGDGHSCALKFDGSVACWGDNGEGQLGDATSFHSVVNPIPVAVGGLGGVVAIVAGRYHTCALKADGTVACFGKNSENELGSASTASQSVVPVAVAGLSNVVALSAGGGYFTCALKADTSVACWGDNESGQLGTGSSTPSQTGAPQTVLTATGTALNRVLAIRSGVHHSCAIVDDGSYSVFCWGDNSFKQVSAGASGVYAATPVPGLSGALMLSVTDYSSCAFSVPSSFKCWGSNYFAESDANGVAGTYVTSPTAVTGLQSTATLPEYASGGNEFMCALQSDGSAKCVGRGGNGQIGNGTNTDALSVQPVSAAVGTFWTWLGVVPR
jgi:alpha-tubulin suppressor-like RCC1 family protein